MTFTIIEGTYHVVGYSPDADSVRFAAHNPQNWNKLDSENLDKLHTNFKKDKGVITLRFQGIDALETHYSPPRPQPPKEIASKIKKSALEAPKSGNHKQPEQLGQEATDVLLKMMGVTDAKWRKFGRAVWVDKAQVTHSGKTFLAEDKGDDSIPGYIATSEAEGNGRPLAWLFMGKSPYPDGSTISLDELAKRIPETLNYKLLRQGVAYPYFFMTLRGALRLPMAEAAKQAYDDAKNGRVVDKTGNVWLSDLSVDGVDISDLAQLHNDMPIYPYLFRKIVKHWYSLVMQQYWDACLGKGNAPTDGDYSLDMEALLEDANPYMFVVSDQDFVRLSEILEVGKQTLKLTRQPYDLVFLS